jgi:hypothetical protein
MTGPGQLSTDEKAMVLEALAKSPSSKGLSKTALETLVTTTTTGWKAGLSEWMVVTPFKFEGAISVNVATGGALSFLHDPGTDSDGFEVEPRTIPIGGVSDADMPGKHREVGAQIFRAMTRNEPYSDIKYWNAQFSCSPAIPASGTTPKHYDLSISIQGTLIRYFRMERDDKGNPTVPDVDNAAHYAQSTTKTRLTF